VSRDALPPKHTPVSIHTGTSTCSLTAEPDEWTSTQTGYIPKLPVEIGLWQNFYDYEPFNLSIHVVSIRPSYQIEPFRIIGSCIRHITLNNG